MYASTRYILFLIIALYFSRVGAHNAVSLIKERKGRHIFPLLGYLHGYKIGQNFALQLPPFVLSPIIIVPSVNQQQSVNIQKSSAEENYQESGGTIQNISPARIVSASSKIKENIKESNQFTTSEIIGSLLQEKNKFHDIMSDTLRQTIVNDTDTTEIQENIDEYTTTTSYDETTETELENFVNKNITKPSGLYPNAAYNNDIINNLSITVEPLKINLTVPNFEDRWNNFTQSSQFNNNDIVNNSNSTIGNVIVYPSTKSYITKYYPYANPWYKEKVDRQSITTNSYTNEDSALPPTYDDRWQKFSSLRKSNPSSGFRPLAGLYYDGFLHKSLSKKNGFIPYRTNGYYYN